MNSYVRRGLYSLLAIAAISGLVLLFYQNFEQVEQTQWKPLTGEAKTNPLYASKLFLRRMGIPTKTVENLQSLTTLPSTDTAILISTSRQTLREAQFQDLIAWVRQGGHLIIASVADWNTFLATSPLVNEPDEPENQSKDEPVYYDESDEEFIPTANADPMQDFLNVEIHDTIKFSKGEAEKIKLAGSRPLALGPDYFRAIELNSQNENINLEQIDIGGKNVMIRQQVDDGLITLVSDFDFISNHKLGEYDHAEILWHIVRGKPMTAGDRDLTLPEAVWLIHSEEVASLLALIWRYFWALALTLGVLLLLWVLRVSRRFGPMIPKETEDRRNLLEHIDASGAYYWKQHNHAALIDSTRTAAQQQLAKRIPGWSALPQEQQIQHLSKRLSIDESTLLKALYADISSSPYEFTETIKQLEHIRTRL